MIIYSMIVRFMPKMVVVSLRCVAGGEGSFGLFGGLFQSLTPQGAVQSGFAWLAWFCQPRQEVLPFPGLGEAVAAILQLSLR